MKNILVVFFKPFFFPLVWRSGILNFHPTGIVVASAKGTFWNKVRTSINFCRKSTCIFVFCHIAPPIHNSIVAFSNKSAIEKSHKRDSSQQSFFSYFALAGIIDSNDDGKEPYYMHVEIQYHGNSTAICKST